MYVVAMTARNITDEALHGSQHHSLWKVPGKGSVRETASEHWTGASEQASLCALSWFPVTGVDGLSLIVQVASWLLSAAFAVQRPVLTLSRARSI